MNHAGLVESVAAATGLSRAAAAQAVGAVVDGVVAALRAGEEVRVAGLGVFAVAARAARQGRDPRTGAAVRIAASKAVRFRAAKAAKDAVNAAAPRPQGARARPAAQAAA